MSSELLRHRMVVILRSVPCRWIDFSVGGFRASPAGYERVARLLASRAIKIAIEYNDEDSAFYDGATNTLTFPVAGFGRTVDERALMVHELTHALEDVQRRSMGELELEVAAYVAGALYARYTQRHMPGQPLSWSSRGAGNRRAAGDRGLILVTGDGPSAPTRSQQSARVFAAANAAADSLIGRPGASLSASHYLAVASALSAHEFYADHSDGRTRNYDGIR